MRYAPLLIMIVALLNACTNTAWNRNIYEGIRNQQSTTHPDRPSQPSYDQYQKERQGNTP